MFCGNPSMFGAEKPCYISVSEGLKSFKSIKIIKRRKHEKLPLVFASLKLYWISLSLDSSGQFFGSSRCDFNKKQKHDEFASLIKLFARSGCIRLHKNVDFLEFKALKSGFAGSLGATFQCDARRHSLYIYRKDSNCTHTDKNEPYLFQRFV